MRQSQKIYSVAIIPLVMSCSGPTVEKFESNLFPIPCEVSYTYTKENAVPNKELLDLGKSIVVLQQETGGEIKTSSGSFIQASSKVITQLNDLLSKAFPLTGNDMFVNFKVHSAKLRCK